MEADDTKAGKVKKIIDGMPKNDINNGRRACDKLSEDAIPQGLCFDLFVLRNTENPR